MLKIILAIVIIVILIIFVKLCITKFRGGFSTTLCDYVTYNNNIDVNELSNCLYHGYRYEKYNQHLYSEYDFYILENVRNLRNTLYNFEDPKLCKAFKIVPKEKGGEISELNILNLQTIIGGIAESISYLTYKNVCGIENFHHNIIECEDYGRGSFNVVFICLITPCTETEEKESKRFALRIKYKFDKTGSDGDCFENYADLIAASRPNELKHFVVSKVPNFKDDKESQEFLNNLEKDNTCLPTRWYLMECYEESETKDFDLQKYFTAAKTCANRLHSNGLMYRDWKLGNFMIKQESDDWNYILSDIDFEKLNYDEIYFPTRTILLNETNTETLVKFVYNKLHNKIPLNLNIALDNMFIYLSLYIEHHYLVYDYFLNNDEEFTKLISIIEDITEEQLMKNEFDRWIDSILVKF